MRCPARALLGGACFSGGDPGRPLVGPACSWTETIPGTSTSAAGPTPPSAGSPEP